MVTKKDGPSARRHKTSRTGPQQKKISYKTMEKWQKIPADLKSVAMFMLEDASSRFRGCGDEEVEETLVKIKENFQHALSTLKVPTKKWIPENVVKSTMHGLRAERNRLEAFEEHLTQALDIETRKVEDLEEKVQQSLQRVNENHGESMEIHPILKELEDS